MGPHSIPDPQTHPIQPPLAHSTPHTHPRTRVGDELIGRVTAAAFSPYLESGIAIVRLHQGCNDNLVELEIETRRDSRAPANLVRLPMYDEEHRIVRGLDTSIP